MTTAADQERAKKLETVRGLLAKASGTDNQHEADAFYAKAEALMERFAIEQWQVDQAQHGVNERPKPEIRWMAWGWYYDTNAEYRSDLYSMFLSCAGHCRCVIAYRGRYSSGASGAGMPVIGLPSDLDYMDMMFTHLMVQMLSKLEPKPDATKSLAENAYELRAAGLNRYRCVELLGKAGLLPEGWEIAFDSDSYNPGESYIDRANRVDLQNKMMKRLRAKVRVAADKWAKEHDLESTSTVNPKVWQRSFAMGFSQEISHRMYEMQAAREDARDAAETASVSIALKDIRQMAVDLYEETWPAPKPCEGCANGDCKIHKKSKAVAYRTVRVSSKAQRSGRKAGSTVDISNGANQRVGGGRGSLPKGS
jgi:hypothetical protein